jgi:hypothetical protein
MKRSSNGKVDRPEKTTWLTFLYEKKWSFGRTYMGQDVSAKNHMVGFIDFF